MRIAIFGWGLKCYFAPLGQMESTGPIVSRLLPQPASACWMASKAGCGSFLVPPALAKVYVEGGDVTYG